MTSKWLVVVLPLVLWQTERWYSISWGGTLLFVAFGYLCNKQPWGPKYIPTFLFWNSPADFHIDLERMVLGEFSKLARKFKILTLKHTHQIKWDFIALSVQSEELRFTDAASANDFCCVHLYLRIHISRWHFHPRSSSIKVFCVVLDVVVDKRRNEKIAVIVTLEKNSRKEISKHT